MDIEELVDFIHDTIRKAANEAIPICKEVDPNRSSLPHHSLH